MVSLNAVCVNVDGVDELDGRLDGMADCDVDGIGNSVGSKSMLNNAASHSSSSCVFKMKYNCRSIL